MTKKTGVCASRRLLAAALAVTAGLGGCTSPLDQEAELALRETVLNAHRARMEAVVTAPVVRVDREESDVTSEMTEERLEELNSQSGIRAYANDPLEVGPDLQGQLSGPRVRMTLRQAVETAVRNNIDLRVARLGPGISRAARVQAEAVFDAVLFSELAYVRTENPGPNQASSSPAGGGDTYSDVVSGQVGIRKPLVSGGTVQVATTLTYTEDQFSGVSSYYDHDISLSVAQPLLRGFGRDVNMTQVELARNAERVSMETLRQNLMALASSVESAYWNLYVAENQLLVQIRLLDRTVQERDRLKKRQAFDVSPVRITQANSFVEQRRSDVIQARQIVRQASDSLKRLIGDPELPVAGEALVLASDHPPEAAIRYSLLDAVTVAMRRRPEMVVALYDIQDAALRQRLADNLRLPLLDLTAGVSLNGSSSSNAIEDAVSETFTHDTYVGWNIGASFEQPIGNRSAEALMEQRILERRVSALAYERTAQDVVLDVKNAMRSVINAYELIGSARATRLATADNLRAIEEQEDAGVALTPEFLLDQKLTTQQRLADSEIQEIRAQADYAAAIAQLFEATGTLLERNRIEVVIDE